jgi:hypothetical protein
MHLGNSKWLLLLREGWTLVPLSALFEDGSWLRCIVRLCYVDKNVPFCKSYEVLHEEIVGFQKFDVEAEHEGDLACA